MIPLLTYIRAKSHAYIAGENCDEAVVIAVCSSAEGDLMDSLMNLHE